MSAAVETNLESKEFINSSTKFIEDPENFNEENITVVTSALQNAENIDQFFEQVHTARSKKHVTIEKDDLANTEAGSPLKQENPSTLRSPRTLVSPRSILSPRVWDPTQHVNSSDEEECTFQPKINANAGKLSKRLGTSGGWSEKLYKDAFERTAKFSEYHDAELSHREKTADSVKIHSNSMKIVLKKLQKAMKSLIVDAEDSDKAGQLTFEGLGTVLHRLGVFQNLEFIPKDNNGEKSSLHINQAKIKPERLNKEIQFHESLWDVCILASKETETISSELVMKFLMVLVEEKCPVSESGYFLLEIMDAALLQSESDEAILKEIKEKKNLWATLDKIVREFRILFDNKTSFMAIYNNSNLIPAKIALDDQCHKEWTFAPEINKKSKRLDAECFDKNILKIIGASEEDIRNPIWRNRNMRLYNYAKYLSTKRSLLLEARIGEELAPCTFVPKTIPYKKPMNQSRFEDAAKGTNRSNASSKYAYFSQALAENSKANRHSVLYEAAKTYKEKLQKKSYASKKKAEMTEMSECTFKPKLNRNFEHSPQRELEFYEGIPHGYKKNVERIKKATQISQNKKVEMEKIPRGENYEKNRKADFIPPTFLSRPKIKKEEVLVYVDVSTGHGRTGRIGIHKDDNAKVLAKNFSATYSLNTTMRESLEKLLQSYIDTYFAQPVISEEREEEQIEFIQKSEDKGEENENVQNQEKEEGNEEPEEQERKGELEEQEEKEEQKSESNESSQEKKSEKELEEDN